MGVISIIGPKGGIGKTTLSINTASALTKMLASKSSDNRVCLIDLDLRLPTIASLLDSHPPKTFYNLFEALENKTYQLDVLRNLYQIVTWFQGYLDKDIKSSDKTLQRCFSLYKNVRTDHFHFDNYSFGDDLLEVFLERGKIHELKDLKSIEKHLRSLEIQEIRNELKKFEGNSQVRIEDYINFIEEYGFSIIGGEVPILGKRDHRRRINEPEFLVLFLEFLEEVFDSFHSVILDTPAGGVNHLSSIMNAIDQVLFVFDLSNSIAINGSIDALHSFIDYYEDFKNSFLKGHLIGLDKAYADRLVAHHGKEAIAESLLKKRLGIVFNRVQDSKEIVQCLDQMREYLDILDKFKQYGERIHILGFIPHTKIINITNNRGALFYAKDEALSGKMDLIAFNIASKNQGSPTLENSNQDILNYLQKYGRPGEARKLNYFDGKPQANVSYDREKTERSFTRGLSIP